MSAVVYWLYFFAACALFIYCGRRLAGPRWNNHRVLMVTLIVVFSVTAAIMWPFTGILAVIVWLAFLARNRRAARRLQHDLAQDTAATSAGTPATVVMSQVSAEQHHSMTRGNSTQRNSLRTVFSGLAASAAFVIGLIAFVGLSDSPPAGSVNPDASTQTVTSVSSTPTLTPMPTPVPATRTAPSAKALVPTTTLVAAPPPPTPASAAFARTPAARTVAPAPTEANPTYHTASCGTDYYRNSDGNCVHRPEQAAVAPAGATARCVDGTYSFSQHRQGTCSHHGGVAEWL